MRSVRSRPFGRLAALGARQTIWTPSMENIQTGHARAVSQNEISRVVSLSDLLCLRQRYLILQLVKRNLKIRFRKSYLGLLWTMLIPLATTLVYALVFKHFLKVQIPNYLVFLLSGVLPWNFFYSALITTMECLFANQSVLNKVPLKPYVFVFGEIVTAFFYFFLSLPILLLAMVYEGVPFHWLQLFIPLVLMILCCQVWGLGLLLAYGFVYFRDLRHLMTILFQLWFYLTPILYHREMIPVQWQWISWLNPIAGVFEMMHRLILMPYAGFPLSEFITALFWAIFFLWVAYLVVNRLNHDIVEKL